MSFCMSRCLQTSNTLQTCSTLFRDIAVHIYSFDSYMPFEQLSNKRQWWCLLFVSLWIRAEYDIYSNRFVHWKLSKYSRDARYSIFGRCIHLWCYLANSSESLDKRGPERERESITAIYEIISIYNMHISCNIVYFVHIWIIFFPFFSD